MRDAREALLIEFSSSDVSITPDSSYSHVPRGTSIGTTGETPRVSRGLNPARGTGLPLNACGCGRGRVYEFGRPADFCAECATDRVRFSKRLSMRLRRGSRQWYKPDAPPPLRSVLNGQRYRARLLAELLHGTLSEIAERYYAAPWLYALVLARPHGTNVCASHRGAAHVR